MRKNKRRDADFFSIEDLIGKTIAFDRNMARGRTKGEMQTSDGKKRSRSKPETTKKICFLCYKGGHFKRNFPEQINT